MRYCDSNTPVMDKIFFLSHRKSEAIKYPEELFNEVGLFSTEGLHDADLLSEMDQVFHNAVGDMANYAVLVVDDGSDDGNGFDADADNSDVDDEAINGSVGENEEDGSDVGGDYGGFSFGSKLVWHWEHRKIRVEHPYAITGWALCVMNDVRQDVNARFNGEHRIAMEIVIKCLHHPPCPNQHPEVAEMSVAQIVDVFWNEFKAFRNMAPPFHGKSRWATTDVAAGRSHLWHEKYSLPYTKVFGFVACRVTLKQAGIGPAKRSWGAVKQIKDGKRSHIGSDSLEKRALFLCLQE